MATQNLGGGRTYTIAAEVGLLTRNVKIVGESDQDLLKQAFGARVLVGTYMDEENKVYKGVYMVMEVPPQTF